MEIFFFLVSFIASIFGSICGIGGGIIIKPTLDLLQILNVNTISFLSGCTVLLMSIVSILKGKNNEDKELDFSIAIPLAVGAILGNDNYVGLIQSIVLSIVLVITIYIISHIRRGNKFKKIYKKNIFTTMLIGFTLGILSSFLGIGGGPLNIIVLTLFFLLSPRAAAMNNLFIILFSQLSSLLYLIISREVPVFDIKILFLMVMGGIMGGLIGSHYRIKFSNVLIEKLFLNAMFLVLIINLFNAFKFYQI